MPFALTKRERSKRIPQKTCLSPQIRMRLYRTRNAYSIRVINILLLLFRLENQIFRVVSLRLYRSYRLFIYEITRQRYSDYTEEYYTHVYYGFAFFEKRNSFWDSEGKRIFLKRIASSGTFWILLARWKFCEFCYCYINLKTIVNRCVRDKKILTGVSV